MAWYSCFGDAIWTLDTESDTQLNWTYAEPLQATQLRVTFTGDSSANYLIRLYMMRGETQYYFNDDPDPLPTSPLVIDLDLYGSGDVTQFGIELVAYISTEWTATLTISDIETDVEFSGGGTPVWTQYVETAEFVGGGTIPLGDTSPVVFSYYNPGA